MAVEIDVIHDFESRRAGFGEDFSAGAVPVEFWFDAAKLGDAAAVTVVGVVVVVRTWGRCVFFAKRNTGIWRDSLGDGKLRSSGD